MIAQKKGINTGEPFVNALPFLKNKKYGGYEKSESNQVIPGQFFFFEKYQGEDHEHRKGDHFLNGFQLHKTVRTSVFTKTRAVGGHLEEVFKKSKPPADQDHGKETQGFPPGKILKPEMPVPGKRHESIGDKKKENGLYSPHSGSD
jgi:hypothetical protein